MTCRIQATDEGNEQLHSFRGGRGPQKGLLERHMTRGILGKATGKEEGA